MTEKKLVLFLKNVNSDHETYHDRYQQYGFYSTRSDLERSTVEVPSFGDKKIINKIQNKSIISNNRLIVLNDIKERLDSIEIEDFILELKTKFPEDEKINQMMIGFFHISYHNGMEKHEILNKVFTILKIIPLLYDFNTEFYFDEKDNAFSVVVYGKGTLKIKVKKKNIIEYAYAINTDTPIMVSSEGYFRVTSFVENAKFFRKITGFVR